MHEEHGSADKREVKLCLELDSALERVLALDDPLHVAVCREICRGLAEILDTLGIPGNPTVEIAALERQKTRADRFLRLMVNGELCRYPDELLQAVHSYVRAMPLGPERPTHILAWLRELCAGQPTVVQGHDQSLVEFLGLVCLEIVKRQPSVLMGPEQVTAYQASLAHCVSEPDTPPVAWPPDKAWLLPVLRRVLARRISLAQKSLVVPVLREGLAMTRSQDDIVEDLIVALRPEVIEIQLPPAYLRQLTTDDSGSAGDRFVLMHDGLFYELGLRFPPCQFVPAEPLKPQSFAFKINHLATLPSLGLQSDQCLVNDTPERLGLLNIQGEAATDPANGNAASIIDLRARHLAESAGLATWNQMEHLVRCLAAELKANSACLLHLQAVQGYLEQLQQGFSALVDAVLDKFSVGHLTRVLRGLLAEEISIRNMRAILESLANYDYVYVDPVKNIVLDDRLPIAQEPYAAWLNDTTYLTSFVRIGLKHYISHKYTRGQNTLIVYLLEAALEKRLSEYHMHEAGEKERGFLDEDERDKIVAAIRSELNALPQLSYPPAMLTTIHARPVLWGIVARDFPRLSVLAYDELSLNLNVQPIARITLDV